MVGCFTWPVHASLLGNIKHPRKFFSKLALLVRQMSLLFDIQQTTMVYQAAINFVYSDRFMKNVYSVNAITQMSNFQTFSIFQITVWLYDDAPSHLCLL
jgi:hypothetical protein